MTIKDCFICGESVATMHTRKGATVEVDLDKARPVRFNPKKDRKHICKSTKGLIR